MELLTIILLVLILAGIILLVVKKSSASQAGNEGKIVELERSLARIEQSLREDFRINREESSRLAKENRNLNVKVTHEAEGNVNDVFIFESFVTDENRVQSVKGFEDLPYGTWFMTMKVNNDDVWNKVKQGEFNGFSLEALFKLKPVEPLNDAEIKALMKLID